MMLVLQERVPLKSRKLHVHIHILLFWGIKHDGRGQYVAYGIRIYRKQVHSRGGHMDTNDENDGRTNAQISQS
jgi:hypothetical protein